MIPIRRNQRGAAAIEFALILPVLVLLILGIIEFSVALYDKAVITNASREGARAGIVFRDPPVTDGEIVGVVTSYCQNRMITFGSPGQVTSRFVCNMNINSWLFPNSSWPLRAGSNWAGKPL
jgi:Flp pilus assembly protein TadG